MAERDEAEVESAPKPKRVASPRPKAGGGGGQTAVFPWIIALAALGLSGYLFLQLGALNKRLQGDTGPKPKGQTEAEGGAAEAGGGAGVFDWRAEPEAVDFEMGQFTANTSDGRAAKMDLWLRIESYYVEQEWEAYAKEKQRYEEALAQYYGRISGTLDESGKPAKKKGSQAYVDGRFILAAEGGEVKVEPLKMPEEPQRPLTVLEQEIVRQRPMVKDVVIEQINIHTAAELTSAEGKTAFKKAIIDALSAAIDPHFGTIKGVFFTDLVTT
jgi:hypothetical protein